MHPPLFLKQRKALDAIADAWLGIGASAIDLWAYGQRVGVWPESAAERNIWLAAPIEVTSRAVGELRIAGVDGPQARARLHADALLLGQLAALEHELHDMTGEFVDQQEQLLALYDLTRATRRHVQVDETLHAFTLEVRRLVQTDMASIVLDGDVPTVTQDPSARLPEAFLIELFGEVQGADRPIMHNEPCRRQAALGVQNVLVVPIPIRSRIDAALILANKAGGFHASDAKFAYAIADLIGVHLEWVLLHEQALAQTKMRAEMELVQQIQLRLLPDRPPRVPGLDIYARSQPASEVGGDFYDFVSTPQRPFVFAVGDVTGKGIGAALVMAMTRTALHSKARFAPDPSPALILRRANEDLYADLTEVSMFVTAFVGQYDPHRNQFCFANAGHAPVMVCHRGEPARLLEADAPPMGVLPENLGFNHAIPFGPGDVLVAATDGFSEASDVDGAMFGIERLMAVVEAHADQPAHAIADAIFATVQQFGRGHPQDDDQTLVVIKGQSS